MENKNLEKLKLLLPTTHIQKISMCLVRLNIIWNVKNIEKATNFSLAKLGKKFSTKNLIENSAEVKAILILGLGVTTFRHI